MSARRMSVWMAIIVGTTVGVTFGQGVGGNSPTETTHRLFPWAGIPEDYSSWGVSIGSADAPISVELDAAGPAWVKRFHTYDGSPISWPNGGIVILEDLVVAGGKAWTGWHMDMPSGFTWRSTMISGPYYFLADGHLVSANILATASSLDATFPPLPPGTHVNIEYRIGWTSTTPLSGTFEMRQYPTPEPASLLFMVAAGSLMIRRRSIRAGLVKS